MIIQNVQIFDGHSEQLQQGMHVQIIENKIAKISASPIHAAAEIPVIDGSNHVLMPGMIDTHTHITMAAISFPTLLNSEREYIGIAAANEARRTLFRGFTTIRDMAGPSFGIKQAIDEGLVQGPRIYPSGAAIGQTSGHVDLRGRTDPPRCWCDYLTPAEKVGVGMIADGVPQVLTAVREQLRLGASQIKVMAGGGIASKNDPIDVVQYSAEEMEAAVEAATSWGTYVAVHVYNAQGITRAIQAGVKCIEHGNLIDEPTMQLMAEKNIFLSPQALTFSNVPASLGEAALKQAQLLNQGLDQLFSLAKKYNIKVTFSTDLLFDAATAALQSKEITARLRWFSPVEILRQATSVAAQLLELSGNRNPYPGKLGVIAEGAYADMLLVNGNPLADLALLEDPERNLSLIIKDGKMIKNIL